MQSTENNAETRLDLEAIGMRAEAAKQARDYSGNTSRHRAITNEASAEDVPALLTALAAERDRADRAEARIADSPHDSKCKFPVLGWNCTCWKQEKDANGL